MDAVVSLHKLIKAGLVVTSCHVVRQGVQLALKFEECRKRSPNFFEQGSPLRNVRLLPQIADLKVPGAGHRPVIGIHFSCNQPE